MRPLRSGPGAPRRATADNKGRLEGHFDKHHQDDAFQPSLQQCRQVTPVTARSHGGVVRARSGGLAAPSPPRAGGHARAKLSVTPSRRSRGRTLRDGWMLTRLLTTGPDDRGRVWMCRRLRPWSGDRCGCPWTVLILLRIRRRWLRPTIATRWLRWLRGWGRSLPRGFRCSGRGRSCAPGPLALG